MVATRSRSASSGGQQANELHHRHAIHRPECVERRDRAHAPRPAREPSAQPCTRTHANPSTRGADSKLHGAVAAPSDAQGPAPPLELDTRSIARRTELRRMCRERGIDSICDEPHVLEDLLARDIAQHDEAAECAQHAAPSIESLAHD